VTIQLDDGYTNTMDFGLPLFLRPTPQKEGLTKQYRFEFSRKRGILGTRALSAFDPRVE